VKACIRSHWALPPVRYDRKSVQRFAKAFAQLAVDHRGPGIAITALVGEAVALGPPVDDLAMQRRPRIGQRLRRASLFVAEEDMVETGQHRSAKVFGVCGMESAQAS